MATDSSQSRGSEEPRHEYLSQPKRYPIPQYTTTKWLSRGPEARWGTQEMLTPPSDAAKKAVATPRVELLARPKNDFRENPSKPIFLYSCGRESQLTVVNDGAKNASATPRVQALANPKQAPKEFQEREQRDQFTYSCGRTSPIWPVNEQAKTTPERPHTTNLAQPKKYHRQFNHDRSLPTQVSEPATRAVCSGTIEALARPKSRKETQFREPMWEVSSRARKATASPRIIELARYKPMYEGFHHDFDQGMGYEKMPRLIRPITRNAKNAVASSRIREISVPIVRESMDKVQFNPEAFIIKRSALNAYCPQRITELAQPTVR